ncbi:chemotaxis-specific protein-glutamate methyltransferase CheB [Stigmatella aurantiaca]|uniref:Protein-glutamate methylesterase/protein-glutamine glutaminase n=1 Tax=Stigmatella aurantiaca (strain DW4/3-1) TaxID=378806 RepID=Q091N0_STIAD|nr:chemotaxis-specific protein-glutamate methyltransferase CheB [Stigmatella aurantiaca]ADO68669.1 Chemotaxis response regulator protein-glutamate methylesterase [Stigmatella aurantiaca DW4/3-1]EAU66442.1 chemotaxis response regulator protein-glutamate methylesterase group 2operon [Stigmatella aurantiaca DW4/3-1]
MDAPIRVLVVDDSAFARKVLRQVLTAAQGVQVVDTARDGLDALEKISELRPDVVTLDLLMPHLDGLGVLKALAAMPSPPRVVVVSTAEEESELAVSALQTGAVELVHKPTALATERLYEMGAELVAKVRTAASAVARPGMEEPVPVKSKAAPVTGTFQKVVVVGTSTGGPAALGRLMSALPEDFPVPLALALHIPPGYTEALARRLDKQSALEVVEASEGVELKPGRAVLAQAGMHLLLNRKGHSAWASLATEPVATAHHPSVDVLFQSAVAGWGRNVVGVVLTGMGDDGLAGARAIHAAGGQVLTESAESCVVYGMPRVVVEAGLSHASAPIERMAALLARSVR